MIHAIDDYLQLRRAAGFQLRDTEALLKEFARFAAERVTRISRLTPQSLGPDVQHR